MAKRYRKNNEPASYQRQERQDRRYAAVSDEPERRSRTKNKRGRSKRGSDPYSYGDGYSYVPEKRKKKGGVLTKILIFVFFGIFLVSGAMLVNELLVKPYFNDKTIEDIQTEMSTPSSAQEEKKEIELPDGKKETVVINDTVRSVNKLREKYSDMSGWVKIPGTEVHFPVMKSSEDDPEYYLYRNYKGEDTEYGSIFLDVSSDIFSDNQILHGHSMLDERMFYGLIDFGKEEVYKNSPIVNYDTYAEAGKWKIVAVFKTNTFNSQGEYFDYFQSDFDTQDEKMDYIYNVMMRSIIDTGVDIAPEDRFITLSTCSYELEGFRTAVVARKVREGEDENVDTSKFKLRGDETLYPEGWYNVYGGSMPSYPETYAEGKEQGYTDWFDKKQ